VGGGILNNKTLVFFDNLAEFLGNSDGMTTEEIEAELIEEMGEERYRKAKERFMLFIEKQKEKLRNGKLNRA
jgi:hypothetical protein